MKKNVAVTTQRSLFERFAAAPHLVWSVLFIITPLLFVAYYAFTDDTGAFTLLNLSAFFTDYFGIFLRSVKLAVIATLICLVIGYPVAYCISRAKPHTQKILLMLIMLPMWMNFLLRTYSWMTILQDKGLINSFLGLFGIGPLHILGTEGAVVVGMVYDYLPYMIVPIYTVMSKLDYRLVEAAQDLGCSHLGVLRRVILPLSISGVISGITMVFVPSISTFYISQKLSGGKFYLIGDAIESQYLNNNYHMVASLSLVLMLILLIGLAIVNHFTDEEGGMVP